MKVVQIYLVLFLLALPISAGISAAAEEPGTGRVSGRIIAGDEAGAVGSVQVGGVPVVLLRFTLDDSGKPQGGPISRQAAAADGSYDFTGVTIEPGAAYQLGTRVGGRLLMTVLFVGCLRRRYKARVCRYGVCPRPRMYRSCSDANALTSLSRISGCQVRVDSICWTS